MNVVLKLFALQPGWHSPAEALAGLGPLMAKSSCFPFLSFLLFPGNGPARFIAGADNGFTLAPRFARTTMHNTNATPLTAGAGRGLFSGICPVSYFFSRIAVILCVLALAGCDYFFVEESITSKRLKEISVGEYKYLRDIHGGQWEKVCVLPPYYGGVIGLSDKKKEAFVDEKIVQFDLVISEGNWHLVFFRNAHLDEYFDYVSFRISRKLDIRHNNYLEKEMDDFKRVGFSPSYCADINQAAIFKFEQRWREDVYTNITLGVIDQ